MTLEQLEAQRAALKAAMRSGARSVAHGTKRVDYRTYDEMKAALDDIEREIAASGGARRRKSVVYHDVKTGL